LRNKNNKTGLPRKAASGQSWRTEMRSSIMIMNTTLHSLTKANAQIRRTTFKSILRTGAFGAALALSFNVQTSHAAGYQAIQTLAQGGAFPVNGLAGDAFGQAVTFNKEFLFVSSPGSQPAHKSIAGAVFVYRWDGAQYQPTQTITTGGTGDHLGMLQILADGDWLALGVIGTPVGPQINDAIADQDFRGAVLIYRLNASGQWQLTQTLDSNTPGLEGLSTLEGGGLPVLATEQGADLGLRMALDAEHGWMFVSALYQAVVDDQNASVMNAGKVFAFRLDNASGTWQFAQALTNPDGSATNDGFGAAVAVKGSYVMIGNGPIFQGPHPNANSAVHVYKLGHGTWQPVQRLTGSQSDLTPFFFPQIHPDPINIGDSFGNAIALDNDQAVITAPLESREVPGAVYTGAAYFFRLKRNGGDERWVLTQRVESEDPGSFAFGAFSVSLHGQTAIVGDMGWSGPAGTYQGAAHVYQRSANTWNKTLTLSDPSGTPSASFGTGVALGPDGRLAVGSSPFLGFFVPVVFRPPPAAAPPVAPGKVIVYTPAED
jgi:hypothetical protein